MKSISINVEFFYLMLFVCIILFHGEPDIIDAVVFNMTGIWQTSSGLLGLEC